MNVVAHRPLICLTKAYSFVLFTMTVDSTVSADTKTELSFNHSRQRKYSMIIKQPSTSRHREKEKLERSPSSQSAATTSSPWRKRCCLIRTLHVANNVGVSEMEEFCFLLSVHFHNVKHVYVVHTEGFGDAELPNSAELPPCDLNKTFTFVSGCSPRAPMKSVAPVMLMLDSPRRHAIYQDLLAYCFPWINIICRLPMNNTFSALPSRFVSRGDLECCDSFFLEFQRPTASHGFSDPTDIFAHFEEIVHTNRSSLRWYSARSRTVCSRCGWTRGHSNSSLSLGLTNAEFHVLIHDVGIYTRRAKEKKVKISNNSNNVGDLQGFERSLVDLIARKFNFTVKEFTMSRTSVLGVYPDEELHRASKSLVSRLLTRGYHMAYGDISIGAIRSQYGDFSSPIDSDHLTAASKVTENGRSFAELADGPFMACHVCLSLILALYLSRRAGRISLSVVFRNFSSLVLRPVYPGGGLSACETPAFLGRLLSALHGLCALVITAVISAVTMTLLSKRTFSGLFKTGGEVLAALQSPRAVVSISPQIRAFFLDNDDELMDRIFEKHNNCSDIVEACIDQCVISDAPVCLAFGEAVHIAEYLRMKNAFKKTYICPSLGFDILQGFLFNKGCFLNRIFSREINRAVAMNLVARFKLNAGVQTYEHKRELTTVFKRVSLRTLQNLSILYSYAWLVALITLFVECASRRAKIFRGFLRPSLV